MEMDRRVSLRRERDVRHVDTDRVGIQYIK